MSAINSPTTVAQPFCPVKPSNNSQLPLFPVSMIHHKSCLPGSSKVIVSYGNYRERPYGVSRSRRVLSPQLLLKKFDLVRDCLQSVLGLTTAQREVTLRLLRFWAYYGKVYPKEATITEQPGCKKVTFWRTIRLLKDMGLISVVHRYVLRPHAQISNLYRLDRLALLLARYLAEHGTHFWEKWLRPALAMPGQQFWSQIFLTPGDRVGPGVVEFSSS